MFALIMRLNNICGCCSVQLSIDNLPDQSAGVFEGKAPRCREFLMIGAADGHRTHDIELRNFLINEHFFFD